MTPGPLGEPSVCPPGRRRAAADACPARFPPRRSIQFRHTGRTVEKDIVDVIQTRIGLLSYFGHVTRTANDRFSHILHRRPNGRPKKKWIDNIRKDCKAVEPYTS